MGSAPEKIEAIPSLYSPSFVSSPDHKNANSFAKPRPGKKKNVDRSFVGTQLATFPRIMRDPCERTNKRTMNHIHVPFTSASIASCGSTGR